jgi:murein DD-endopeptidase MepM/ murein hydrolase activator NlpD
MKKKASILLVPPQGSRVKTVRVRFWMMLLVVLMVAAGVAGFFVPVERLILTTQELDQKNYLEEQNKRLHQNVGATLKLLSGLKEQTSRLESKKNQAAEIIGLPQAPPASKQASKYNTASAKGAAEILSRLDDSEKLIVNFVNNANAGGRNLFDSIPIAYPVSRDSSIISKRFGMARDPFTDTQKPHYGTDFAAEVGTPVMATANGIVTLVENHPVWGLRVVISHGRGLSTVYAHLGVVRAAQGRPVKRGDMIGTVGMSGLTTGPHLHYEILQGDERLNPEEYFFPSQLVASK